MSILRPLAHEHIPVAINMRANQPCSDPVIFTSGTLSREIMNEAQNDLETNRCADGFAAATPTFTCASEAPARGGRREAIRL